MSLEAYYSTEYWVDVCGSKWNVLLKLRIFKTAENALLWSSKTQASTVLWLIKIFKITFENSSEDQRSPFLTASDEDRETKEWSSRFDCAGKATSRKRNKDGLWIDTREDKPTCPGWKYDTCRAPGYHHGAICLQETIKIKNQGDDAPECFENFNSSELQQARCGLAPIAYGIGSSSCFAYFIFANPYTPPYRMVPVGRSIPFQLYQCYARSDLRHREEVINNPWFVYFIAVCRSTSQCPWKELYFDMWRVLIGKEVK